MASKTEDRITIDALKFYVPLFQKGDAAEKKLLAESETLTAGERNHLETLMGLKDLSVDKIAALSGPLITREINKIISTSHLRSREDLFDVLYVAGLDGMKRGLRKFEVDKLNVSSTNYLFQWIVTYAKKELVMLEAPFGIPPSRFQRYKKISAVRKKLSQELERYATNEEVLDYFLSGRADMKTMNGRVGSNSSPSKANLAITLSAVEEQEVFEQQMMSIELLDPLDGYAGDVPMSEISDAPFSESVFGIFSETYNVTDIAKAVIMSDLSSNLLNDDQVLSLQELDQKTYQNYSNQWKNLVSDISGPFYAFLKENVDSYFSEFDVKATISSIENYHKVIKPSQYALLFSGGKAIKND